MVIQKLIQVYAHPRQSGNELIPTRYLIDESASYSTLSILDKIQQRRESRHIAHYKKMQAMLKKVLLDRYGVNCSVINGMSRMTGCG